MPEISPAAPANVRQIFWGWDRPLAELAVAELTKGWDNGLLDLSDVAVVVSTGNAARILKESLAVAAAKKETAVLSPTILTPDGFLAWIDSTGATPASIADTLLAWTAVLQSINLDDFRAVFPRDPVNREFPWALQTANTFRKLQQTIGEAGWSISQAAARLGPDFTEALRWEQLSILEQLYNEQLSDAGLKDRNHVRSAAARNPKPGDGIKKLVVLAVPDSQPLAKFGLQKLAESGFPVDICIHAPEKHHNGFDAWGGVIADYWRELPVNIPDPAMTIRVLGQPQTQAAEIAELCASSASPKAEFAVGILDPEILPLAAAELESKGVPFFDPEGEPFRQHELHWVLSVWKDLLGGGDWSAFARLLRIPEICRVLIRDKDVEDGGISASKLLKLGDEIQMKHLPSSLEGLLGCLNHWPEAAEIQAPLRHAIQTVLQWTSEFHNSPFDRAVTRFLDSIFHNFSPADNRAATAFQQASEKILEILSTVSNATVGLNVALTSEEQLQVMLRLLNDAQLFPEASTNTSVELSGWLELPWQSAPGLIIAGMNEGIIPPSITSDPWVPHSIRGELNLITNEDRFAAHACRLAALIESRKTEAGVIHLLAGRSSAGADPLKPSRLLMLCGRNELPARITKLFHESEGEGEDATPAWSRSWQLKPEIPKNWEFKKLSATAFAKYLACPFRFFLERVLKMEDLDPAKQELDHMDFGNLCHHAFESLAKDEEMSASSDPDAIASFLHQNVSDRMFRLFGKPLSLPLMIQQSSAQLRLKAAARILAKNRAEGWEIRHVETSIHKITGSPWMMDGVEITGFIDMVEQHRESGEWRIIDYKTSADPKSPEEAHLAKGPAKEHQSTTPSVSLEDGRVWTNLQLPIYARALEQHFGKRVTAAYFNLPPASSQTSLIEWPEMNFHLESAVACAGEIIRSIKARHFWPPNAKPKYDSFKRLFVNGAEESVDASLLEAARITSSTGEATS